MRGLDLGPREGIDPASLSTCSPGAISAPRNGSIGALRHDVARDADAVAQFPAIFLVLQVIEPDRGAANGSAEREPHPSAAARAHLAQMHLESVPIDPLVAVIADGDRREVMLEIGIGHIGIASEETARLPDIGGAGSD